MRQFSFLCGCSRDEAVRSLSASIYLMLKLCRRCFRACSRRLVLGQPSSQTGILLGSASSIRATSLTSSAAGVAASSATSRRDGRVPVRMQCSAHSSSVRPCSSRFGLPALTMPQVARERWGGSLGPVVPLPLVAAAAPLSRSARSFAAATWRLASAGCTHEVGALVLPRATCADFWPGNLPS